MADAGAEIEVARAVRYIWGAPCSYWAPAEIDEASETDWQCPDCHDGYRTIPFTAAEIELLDAAATDYDYDEDTDR
jgi:hypothetical protein